VQLPTPAARTASGAASGQAEPEEVAMNQPWDPRRDPWMIDPSAFCSLTSFRDRARHLLRYAILAPSSHNSQPWKFRLELDGIAVLRDLGQELPVADPVGREAVIGIGASLFNLRVAAASSSEARCAFSSPGA
jgi:hypothetical protein